MYPMYHVQSPGEHPAIRMLKDGCPEEEDPRRAVLTIFLLSPLLMFLDPEPEYEMVSEDEDEWPRLEAGFETVEGLPRIDAGDVLPGEKMRAHLVRSNDRLCVYIETDDGHMPVLRSIVRAKEPGDE